MKIGLYFDDKSYIGKDFRNPENGNPGIGGTPFCFLMLAKYYSEAFPNDELFFFHEANNTQNNFSERYKVVTLCPDKIADKCICEGIDLLVLTLARYSQLASLLEEKGIKCVVWVHNFLTYNSLLLLRRSNSATRIVFVGKEQYDRYIDDPIICKSVCIMNMFNTDCQEYKRIDTKTRIVTYTGAIVPSKGFHYIAKYWKRILKEVPDAELYVMGTGALYNNNAKLGKFGIAEESYENKFMKYLLNEKGVIIPSVHFLGVVGPEKIYYYQRTRLGIINPTARTEICPISALEMASCEIPIVSRNRNGMLDVIINGKTGILVNNSRAFCKVVIRLLQDDDLNIKYGNAAKSFVSKKFNPYDIVSEWHKLFRDTLNDQLPNYQKPIANFDNNYKYLRWVNRKVREIPYMGWIPSIALLECKAKSILKL